MKLGSHVLAGLISASGEDRKFPPRHPLNRLNVKNGNVENERNLSTESSKLFLPVSAEQAG